MNEVRRFAEYMFPESDQCYGHRGTYYDKAEVDNVIGTLADRLEASEELNRVAALGMNELEQQVARLRAKLKELGYEDEALY